jgi:hypothetical protein
VKLALLVQNQRIGTGTFQSSLLPNGGVSLKLAMNIDFQGQKASYSLQSQFDKAGRPVSDLVNQSEGGTKKQTSARYGPKEVVLTTVANGKKTSRKVAIPKGKITTMSHHWFLSTKPVAGKKETWLNLDQESLKWQQENATYVGPEKITIGGKQVTAHKVQHSKGRGWYDDKGQPYRLEVDAGGQVMVLERM